ncbi:glycosyl hydrolase family 17 protein [Myxococcota bacterium]|nr:glycosyl hydrolase family 17 protein [Myxococcota bacterium]
MSRLENTTLRPAHERARVSSILSMLGVVLSTAGCATATPSSGMVAAPRPLSVVHDGRWIGHGISYGPHRDGQRPGGPGPTDDQLREDLALLLPHWSLWRVYSSDAVTEALLRVLRSEKAPVKLILGAWIAPETSDGARAANRAEVANVIRLANAYPELVLAINVGNETQVSWSAHRSPAELLIGYLREVRAATTVPVTTADDFGFWLSPESDAVAREVDFLMIHVYAMWNGKQLDEAVAFTREKFEEVGRRHPGHPRILGELGWATQKSDQGEQGKLIKGRPGEAEQKVFLEELLAWTGREQITTLFFEAFDENWKGGPQPDEVEKHWGLFRADRTPKSAMTSAPRR